MALPVILPLGEVMRVGRVIRLGGRVSGQVVGLADPVRCGRLHLPDRVLRVHRAPVIRVRVAVVHVAHVHACETKPILLTIYPPIYLCDPEEEEARVEKSCFLRKNE